MITVMVRGHSVPIVLIRAVSVTVIVRVIIAEVMLRNLMVLVRLLIIQSVAVVKQCTQSKNKERKAMQFSYTPMHVR